MPSPTLRRLLLWLPIAIAVAIGLAWLFRPQPVPVDFAMVERGPMRVSVGEEGRTRVRDVFVLSAPVAGLKRRTPHKVGDPVIANETIVASIEPTDPAFLDQRSQAQAEAAVRAAEAALAFSRAEMQRAQAELEFARSEAERAERLARSGNISESALDEAERRLRTQSAALDEARAQRRVREFELERARAELLPPSEAQIQRAGCDCVHVYSPVSGKILRILNESEAVVAAGSPIAEIGDPRDLEIVVELLSSDAVRVETGQRVIIDEWGGRDPLEGIVRRVEPYGFTKISALGIEEQRVNVLVDITSEERAWSRLGHGFRVETQIVLWEADEVLHVPLTAIFRDGEEWAVFVDEDGIARRRKVSIGRSNGLQAEVEAGVALGTRVILHPTDRISDGVAVAART